MKRARPHEPARWRDRGADAHALESRAALLADAASHVQPLAPRAVARIRDEVVARRSRRVGLFGVHGLGARGRIAFAIGSILVCVTTVGGASVLWRRYVAGRRATSPASARPAPGPAVSAAPRASAARAAVAAPPPALEQPALAEPPPIESPGARAPTRPRALRPPPAPPIEPAAAAPVPPAVGPPPAASEAALVAEALVDLRQRNDARAALVTLDRHARDFPHGVLETEAWRTRIEALVQLGDLKAAVASLDGKGGATEVLGPDLTLTRAELRAAAGRFREALSDFNRVVDGADATLAAAGDERALYGRAVCLGRLGEDERARADLLAYQRRFPDGRFAREVRRLLGKDASTRP